MPRAAVAQFTGSINWEENIASVRRLALRAATAGVNLLCFHELASTIYPAFTNDPGLFRLAERDDGPSVTEARAIAREAGLVIGYPFFEKEGTCYYNSALVLGPRGEVLTKYRKSTIPSGLGRLVGGGSEEYYFQPGNLGFPVVETPFGIRVGVVICYDRNLPEPARCAALNGAELLFVPVTTTQRARSRWELLLCARAVENVLYIAAANRIGQDRGGAANAFYFGESLIVNPRGEVIAHASSSEEDLVWADVDLDLLRSQRRSWLFFDDRRPEQYALISQRDHRKAPG
jgi:N-carbamoylputrescine amidase